jgi:nucleotide-binding universal stress UspA family protein
MTKNQPETTTKPRIVVGIDGSEHSGRALQWAIDEARVRGATVQAVHAWSYPLAMGLGANSSELLMRGAESAAESVLDHALDSLPDDVVVERILALGLAAESLLEAAKGAELLVLGSRGRGGFVGLLLGSVSQQCANHASCPVVIVPGDVG